MDLQLGLSLTTHGDHSFRPRNFTKTNPCSEDPHTLPFLSWNNKPNDEDDPPHPGGARFCNIQMKAEENKSAVGWPPIESWRKKALVYERHPQQPPQTAENRPPVAADQRNQNGGPNSLFVKVKMEGVAIARKLDLRLYHSHHSLKTALISMFTTSNYQIVGNNGWDFTLIYEDQDGDWLLAEDLPWNSFVESVQRLKILVRKRNKE